MTEPARVVGGGSRVTVRQGDMSEGLQASQVTVIMKPPPVGAQGEGGL